MTKQHFVTVGVSDTLSQSDVTQYMLEGIASNSDIITYSELVPKELVDIFAQHRELLGFFAAGILFYHGWSMPTNSTAIVTQEDMSD